MEKHAIIEILKYKCLKYLNGNLHIKKYFVIIEVIYGSVVPIMLRL